jgi:hypothetical protein
MVAKPPIPSEVGALQSTEWDVFGPPPLTPSEDLAAYWAILEGVAATVRPNDFLEKMWVRDAVDLELDVLRGRRVKAHILKNEEGWRIAKLLTHSLGKEIAEKIAAHWHEPEIREQFAPDMARAGITVDTILTQAYAMKLDQLERVEYMIASAETRRNNAFREITHHRQTFGAALRRAVDAVDAEYTEVVPSKGDEIDRLQ